MYTTIPSVRAFKRSYFMFGSVFFDVPRYLSRINVCFFPFRGVMIMLILQFNAMAIACKFLLKRRMLIISAYLCSKKTNGLKKEVSKTSQTAQKTENNMDGKWKNGSLENLFSLLVAFCTSGCACVSSTSYCNMESVLFSCNKL